MTQRESMVTEGMLGFSSEAKIQVTPKLVRRTLFCYSRYCSFRDMCPHVHAGPSAMIFKVLFSAGVSIIGMK